MQRSRLPRTTLGEMKLLLLESETVQTISSVGHVQFHPSNSTLPMDMVVEEYASVIAQGGGMVNSNEFVKLS